MPYVGGGGLRCGSLGVEPVEAEERCASRFRGNLGRNGDRFAGDGILAKRRATTALVSRRDRVAPGRTLARDDGQVRVSWPALGVLAAIGIAVVGGAIHVFDRLGKLEGRVSHLSPEAVAELRGRIGEELGNVEGRVDEVVTRAGERMEAALLAAEGRISAGRDEGAPMQAGGAERRWCNVEPHRDLNQWYGTYETDVEVAVEILPTRPDILGTGRYSCGSLVALGSPGGAQTFVSGGIDYSAAGSGYKCSVSGVTVPRGSMYRVARLEGQVVAWWELRASCQP